MAPEMAHSKQQRAAHYVMAIVRLFVRSLLAVVSLRMCGQFVNVWSVCECGQHI